MNKVVIYAVIAISLGVVMILLPTWLFIQGIAQPKISFALSRLTSVQPPLIEHQERGYSDAISQRDWGILGISFIVASIVYILFRRTPRQNKLWFLHRRF